MACIGGTGAMEMAPVKRRSPGLEGFTYRLHWGATSVLVIRNNGYWK